MNNTTISVIILVLMILICLAILVIYTKYMKSSTALGKKDNEPEKEELYPAGDVLELVSWLKKSPAETGINEKYLVEKGGFLQAPFEGTLFDKPADGSVYFKEDLGEVVKKAYNIYIHSSEFGYEEIRELLIKKYGKPKEESEEPFTQVKGGAVQRCLFSKRGFKLTLEKASEKNYIVIDIK